MASHEYLLSKIILFIFGCAGSLLLCCLFLVVASRGYSLVAVCGLLIAVASLVAQHGLWGMWISVVVARGLNSCVSWVLEYKLIVVAHRCLAAPRFVGSSQTRD